MLNRLHALPLSQEHKEQELHTIFHIAKQNGYPTFIIDRLNTQIKNRKTHSTNMQTQNNKIWVTFGFYSPNIRKVTNIFRNTNLKIAYRATNTIQSILKTHIQNYDEHTKSGIYSLKCNTCNKHYVGQTGRSLSARFSEHNK
jgi:hypothetical protein